MKEGKTYRPIEALRTAFASENSSNHAMLLSIDTHGGEFTVVDMHKEGSDKYVTKVRMKTGEVFDADDSGGDYFEISDSEFMYFEEVFEAPKSGLVSMFIEVTHANAEEMIDLIKKNFGK